MVVDCFCLSGTYIAPVSLKKFVLTATLKTRTTYFDSKEKNYPYRNQNWVLSIYPQTVINWFITALSQPPGPFAQINNTTTVPHFHYSAKNPLRVVVFKEKNIMICFAVLLFLGKTSSEFSCLEKFHPGTPECFLASYGMLSWVKTTFSTGYFFEPAYFYTWL